MTSRKREKRFDDIRALLMSRGTVSTEELVAHTGVSRMTVHRDLVELEQRGALRRTHGGASVERSLLFGASVDYRLAVQQRAKGAIAAHAAGWIEPGQVLMIDDSTTGHAFLKALPEGLPVTVITNFVPNQQIAMTRPNTSLIMLGGDYHPTYHSLLGTLTETSIGMLHADLLITSASALRGKNLFHQSQAVISTRRAMAESSDRRVLLLDSSKIGETALYLHAGVESYDDIVIDDGIDDRTAATLQELDVRLHIVESQPHPSHTVTE